MPSGTFVIPSEIEIANFANCFADPRRGRLRKNTSNAGLSIGSLKAALAWRNRRSLVLLGYRCEKSSDRRERRSLFHS